MEDAYRKVARLEGEVTELSAALEQKQDVITALQVTRARGLVNALWLAT